MPTDSYLSLAEHRNKDKLEVYHGFSISKRFYNS